MASTSKTRAQQQEAEEAAPWEVPPTEGDPAIGEGQAMEVAGEIVDPGLQNAMQTLMDWCQEYMMENAADSAAAMAAEVARILSGEDAESVLSESAPLNGKEHLEKPFMLHGFTLNPTDFTEGWPFYAAMDASIPGTGDRFVITCGGPKVIAALKRLHELGEYPYPVKIRGKETRAGFTVLQLVVAGA
jgi:hypothetical protein